MKNAMPSKDPMEPNTVGEPGKAPDGTQDGPGRPANKPGIDVPAQPGQPTPERTNPDHPGGPPQPVDPGRTPGL